nr:glycophorin-C isoform X1 [Pan troglodytes]
MLHWGVFPALQGEFSTTTSVSGSGRWKEKRLEKRGSCAGKLEQRRVQKWAGVCLKKKKGGGNPTSQVCRKKINEVCLSPGQSPSPRPAREECDPGAASSRRRGSGARERDPPLARPGQSPRSLPGLTPRTVVDEKPQQHVVAPRPRRDCCCGHCPNLPPLRHAALHVPAQGHVPHQ